MKKRCIALCLLLSIGLFVGCEDDDSSSSSSDSKTLIGQGTVVSVNSPRSGYVANYGLDTGYAVWVDSSAFVTRRRLSCSGFTIVAATAIRNGDILGYKYNNETGVDFANRIVMPFEIQADIPECQSGAQATNIQFVVDIDTDLDQIGDTVDNCKNTPNNNQLDTDGDGVGDVCDADPNDSNVQ